jgi:hypothetical protein
VVHIVTIGLSVGVKSENVSFLLLAVRNTIDCDLEKLFTFEPDNRHTMAACEGVPSSRGSYSDVTRGVAHIEYLYTGSARFLANRSTDSFPVGVIDLYYRLHLK